MNQESTSPRPPREPASSTVRSSLHSWGGIVGIACLSCAAFFDLWAALTSNRISFFTLFTIVLIASPYLVFWLATRLTSTVIARLVVVIPLAVCVCFGVIAFMAVDDDAQGGLVLVFAPIYQLGGAILVLCLAVAIDWGTRKFDASSTTLKDCEETHRR